MCHSTTVVNIDKKTYSKNDQIFKYLLGFFYCKIRYWIMLQCYIHIPRYCFISFGNGWQHQWTAVWTTFTLPWESKTFRRDTLRSFLAFGGPLTFLILYARMSFEVNYKVFEKKIWNGKVQLHFQQKYYDLENGWWL